MRVFLIVSFIIHILINGTCGNTNTQDDWSTSIYYDPNTLQPFPMIKSNLNPTNNLNKDRFSTKAPVPALAPANLFIGFQRSNGCSCYELQCGCCAGFNLQQFNFNREGCMNFTYDPHEFSIGMDMFMNDKMIFSNSISAKNPSPFCVPVIIPYLPSVDFCARLFDIHTPGQNLHMCLDFEARIQQAPVLVLHFDCMKMGTQGFSLNKPGDAEIGGDNTFIIADIIPPSTEDTVTVTDIYDEVTEIKSIKLIL